MLRVFKCILSVLFFTLSVVVAYGESREVTIACEWGNISATLDEPTEGSDTAILIVAGSGPTDRYGNSGLGLNTYCYKMLAEELVERGVAVLRYDKRGIARSPMAKEDVPNVVFDDFVEDAVACVEYLRGEGYSRVIVAGHSEGGLIATVMVRDGEDVADGVVLLCAPGFPMDEILMSQLSAQLMPSYVGLMVRSSNIIRTLKSGERVALEDIPEELLSLFHPTVQPFLISNMQYDPAELIKWCVVPVLIVAGGRDIQVSTDNGERLRKALPTAHYALFENMTHVLKDADTSDRMEQIMGIYTNSTLPITAGLADTIYDFVNNLK